MLDLNRWPDAELERALELPRDQRDQFVEQAAGGDAAMLAALRAVLREDNPTDEFLVSRTAVRGGLFDDLCESLAERQEPRLDDGSTLGPYRVDRCIGRGGMGEVYLAHDTRLGRHVALKILADRFVGDPDRLARLRREARALASINHPGIGAIFDVYEEGGVVALVLELVDGPTLADLLARGALPLPDTLAIASQLVDAIGAAHQRGIVHRDLKPSNIKVAPPGTVKILDFGLARAVHDDRDEAPGTSVLPSITVAEPQRTVLGTAPYMSPEQARGQPVDHRADIWAFGCVLYEMLCGRAAFEGETSNDVLAKVLEREPDFDRLPVSTPPAVARLIERCLRKDAGRRLGYIGDARFDLDDAVSGRDAGRASARVIPWPRRRTSVVAALLGLCAGIAVVLTLMRTLGASPPELRLAVPLPADHELVVGQLAAVEASRDGTVIVYRARRNGTMQLFARALDSDTVTPIAGTEDAEGHAVSPDGRWVAFGRGGRVLKTLIAGAPPVVLCSMPTGITAAWGRDGTIVVASGSTLYRVSAAGGTPAPLTQLDAQRGDRVHRTPDLSPDGTIAFTIGLDERTLVAVADRDGRITVLTEGQQPRFVTETLLIFARQQSLWAARYDARHRALVGEPAPIVDGLERSPLNGQVHYAVAGDGSILYVAGGTGNGPQSLVWRDRGGREDAIEIDGRSIARFSMAPDDTRLALALSEHDSRDIWIFDRTRKTMSRLTFDPATESAPIWSPDSRYVAYRSDADGGGIMLQAADGAGVPRRLTRAGGLYHIPYDFTPDGRVLFVEFRTYQEQNVLAVTTDDAAQITAVLTGPGAETRPALSPDGRWLAYQSDESGRDEVYVRPWPDVARAKWRVSANGGTAPAWRRDSREIFFAAGNTLMASPIGTEQDVRPGAAQALFALDGPVDRIGALFTVSPDGQRFLVLRDARVGARPAAAQLHLIMNWLPAQGALR